MLYQLYLLGGRAAAEAAIERARVAGFAGLVVTIDTAVAGIRERDLRNGMKELVGPGLLDKVPFLPNILSHPGWLLGFLRDGGIRPLPNVVIPGQGPMPLLDVGAALASSTVTWADLGWIRAAWRGPIVVKGVLTARRRAARRRRRARRRSPSPTTAGASWTACRPRSAPCRRWWRRSAIASRSGWTEASAAGADIVKALCLGARAVLCGRAYAYGLAAAGEAGVDRAIEILRVDLDRTLRLLGCPSVAALDRSYVNVPKSWESLGCCERPSACRSTAGQEAEYERRHHPIWRELEETLVAPRRAELLHLPRPRRRATSSATPRSRARSAGAPSPRPTSAGAGGAT